MTVGVWLTGRWRVLGRNGAKLVQGREAVAVENAGRANSHQLRIGEYTMDDLAGPRHTLVSVARQIDVLAS